MAGAWGKPRNRYTRSVQPGKQGGMNAQGSANRSGGYGPGGQTSIQDTPKVDNVRPESVTPKPAKKTEPAVGPIKPPKTDVSGWKDPQYRLSMAGHQYDLGTAMAEQARNVAKLKEMFRTTKGGLETQTDKAQQRLGGAMGAAGFGRSGVLGVEQADIQKSFDRQLAEAVSKYGPDARDFERRMAELARQQFAKTKFAEEMGARERLGIRQGELM